MAPAVPPERTQAINEQSPVVKKSANILGRPDLFDSAAQDSCDSPLLAHRLCSQSEEDGDDGFIDFEDLEVFGWENLL